ncbi:MAG: hypothetical protein NTY75_00755 [Candidatus Shapirobacteria bacterium]|nr:hypothetical protein [Candidatus Shapirobacteria bacterium]
MTEQNKMDIYNFEQTSGIPPAADEPTRRDGYKWSLQDNCWMVDVSQSQTKRFEIMLAQNPEIPGIRSAINKERQLDGYCQRLAERKVEEKLAK